MAESLGDVPEGPAWPLQDTVPLGGPLTELRPLAGVQAGTGAVGPTGADIPPLPTPTRHVGTHRGTEDICLPTCVAPMPVWVWTGPLLLIKKASFLRPLWWELSSPQHVPSPPPRQSAPSGPAHHSVSPRLMPPPPPPWRCLVSPGSSVAQSGLDLQEVEVLLPSVPWSGGPWPLRPPSGAGCWAGQGPALGRVQGPLRPNTGQWLLAPGAALGPPSPLLDQVEANTCVDGLTCLRHPDQTGTNHCCPWAGAWG